MSPEPKRPPLPRTTELPVPVLGVFQSIYDELSAAPYDFIRLSENHLRHENRHLYRYVIPFADPKLELVDDGKAMAFMYYEMFSRSAQSQGSQLIEVTPLVIDYNKRKNKSDMLEAIRRKGQEQAFIDAFEEENQLSQNESESSVELRLFWDHIAGTRSDYFAAATHQEDLYRRHLNWGMATNPLLLLRRALYRQQEQNRLNQQKYGQE